MAVGAMVLNAVFGALLLERGISPPLLASWLILLTLLLVVRYAVARGAARALNQDRSVLEVHDRRFRLVSAASQIATGAGIWLVWGAQHETSSYVMTLLICFYAIGTMINLAHDFRSVVTTVPLMMIQPIAFWIIGGDDGIVIAVILGSLTLLMISSARNSYRAFEETIRIRFEKDELLREVEREKENALRSLRLAEAANRSRSFFMAAASHDVRQPLYAATILHDTLMLHPLPAEASHLLEQQGKALATASALFDNLLDLSRFESGAIEPTFTNVQLRELLREIEAEFLPVATARGLRLTVTPTDHVVRSDYDLLDRMLRNLVSNAVKYTNEGQVTVSYTLDGTTLQLHVEDTGIGIAPADQERVFGEFVQLDNPQRSRDKGVGLGLAIVRHVSGLLHHPIHVESAPQRGTRFTVELPLADAIEDQQIEGISPQDEVVDLAGRHVWIVEDDRSVREALESYFRARDCFCSAAANLSELDALEESSARLPDMVLFDDMLGPDESGLERARQLASRVDPRNILVMTGSADLQRWEELKASGFTVLRKPVFASALNSWLTSLANREQESVPEKDSQR